MIRIMFVCTGNICRSPMAELVMKQLVRKEGLDWVISSAANTGDEVGNPVYPAAGLLGYYRGDRLALINRDETPDDDMAGLVLHASLGDVFSQL